MRLSRLRAGALLCALASLAFAASASANTVTIKSSAEGSIAIANGDDVAAGYQFSIPNAQHADTKVAMANASVVIKGTCSNGSSANSLTIPLSAGPSGGNDDPAASTAWYPGPRDDDDDPSKFQGETVASVCGGGSAKLTASSGATLTATVLATQTSQPISVQFHYRDPRAKAFVNYDCTTSPEDEKLDACHAAWSSTASVVPDMLFQCTPCALQFGTQPHAAVVGQHISGADFSPSAGPVTVQIVDVNGHVVTTSSAPVTIALGSATGGGTLSGTRTVNAVNGTASFGDLALDKAGYTYTLAASSSGDTGATSSGFDEHDIGSATTCAENTDCQGQANDSGTTGTNGQTLSVVSPFDPVNPDAGLLTVALDHGNGFWSSNPACGGATALGPDTDDFLMTNSARAKFVTGTLQTSVPNQAALQSLIQNQEYCLAAPYPFQAKTGPAVAGTLPDGTPGFIGLLGDCPAAGTPTDPCVSSRSGTLNNVLGTLQIKVTVPAGKPGDPWGGRMEGPDLPPITP